MKKLVLSITVLLQCFFTFAQSNEPLQLVREGVQWVNFMVKNHLEDNHEQFYYTYTISGDTIVEGKTYKKCHWNKGTEQDYLNAPDSVVALLRQDGNKVYCLHNHVLAQWLPDVVDVPQPESELLLYDFDNMQNCAELQTYIQILGHNDYPKYVGNIEIAGHMCRQWQNVIEGIGFYPTLPRSWREEVRYGDLLNYCYGLLAGFGGWYSSTLYVLDSSGVIFDNSAAGLEIMSRWTTSEPQIESLKTREVSNPNYYTLAGQCLGTVRPSAAGIYIHKGRKVVVR